MRNFPVEARDRIATIFGSLHSLWLFQLRSETVDCCPLCGGRSLVPHLSHRWHGLLISLVKCQSCELMLQSPRLDSGGLHKYYRTTYRTNRDPKHQGDLFERGQRRGEYILEFLREHGMDCRGRIIREVGCGYGGILERFRQEGCSVAGCDMDPKGAAFGEKKKLDIRPGALEVLLDGTKADIVIISHVLEHMADPVRFLQNVKPLLKIDGVVYLEVPGIENPRVVKRGYGIQPGHLCYFSLNTLQQACERAGYRFVTGNNIIQGLIRPSAETQG